MNKKAFTLVELLVVMSIIGILAAVGIGSFRTTQMKGRDAQRKSDLKQISNSLDLYYADYGQYPSSAQVAWGSEFSDAKGTIYFKTVPSDPLTDNSYSYLYRVSADSQMYQLFAQLENTEDRDRITTTYACGAASGNCNYALTSANTNASDW